MVHVKPSPLTERIDFAPPPMGTTFGWWVTPGIGVALAP